MQPHRKIQFRISISASESFASLQVVYVVQCASVDILHSTGALFQYGAGELNSTQPHLPYLSSCYGRVFTPGIHSSQRAGGDQLQQTVTRVADYGSKGCRRRCSLIVRRANQEQKTCDGEREISCNAPKEKYKKALNYLAAFLSIIFPLLIALAGFKIFSLVGRRRQINWLFFKRPRSCQQVFIKNRYMAVTRPFFLWDIILSLFSQARYKNKFTGNEGKSVFKNFNSMYQQND